MSTEPMSSERAAVETALLAIGLREAALEIAEQARRATGDAESHRACDFARGELDRVKIKSLPTLRDAARRYLALTAPGEASGGYEAQRARAEGWVNKVDAARQGAGLEPLGAGWAVAADAYLEGAYRERERILAQRERYERSQAEVTRLREALHWIGRICGEDFDHQPPHVAIHRLKVDIPDVVQAAMDPASSHEHDWRYGEDGDGDWYACAVEGCDAIASAAEFEGRETGDKPAAGPGVEVK